MFGWRQYDEGSIPPRRVSENQWNVRCHTGALTVLQGLEWRHWLTEHPDDDVLINFANGSVAQIKPGHPLWEAMAEAANEFNVEVYKLTPSGGYATWRGSASSIGAFDAIAISVKKVVPPRPVKKYKVRRSRPEVVQVA